ARGTLSGMRDVRVRSGNGDIEFGSPKEVPGGVPPASSPDARPAVLLKLHQNELGEYLLIASSGVALRPDQTRYILGSDAIAVGVSPAVAQPRNREAHARLAQDPSLQPRVTVQPQPSCSLGVGAGVYGLGRNPGPRITSADVLEALHRATGMN